MDKGLMDRIFSAERIEELSKCRGTIADKWMGTTDMKEKAELGPVYQKLEDAFQECIMAEAELITKTK